MKTLIFVAILFGSVEALALTQDTIEINTTKLLKAIGVKTDKIHEVLALEAKLDNEMFASDEDFEAEEAQLRSVLGPELYYSYKVAEAIEFERIWNNLAEQRETASE